MQLQLQLVHAWAAFGIQLQHAETLQLQITIFIQLYVCMSRACMLPIGTYRIRGHADRPMHSSCVYRLTYKNVATLTSVGCMMQAIYGTSGSIQLLLCMQASSQGSTHPSITAGSVLSVQPQLMIYGAALSLQLISY